MKDKRWVQHISGRGEKWEVDDPSYSENAWRVKRHDGLRCDGMSYHYLPKSEYRECEPPERWEDVTGECEVGYYSDGDFTTPNGLALNGYLYITHEQEGGYNICTSNKHYRVRKVDGAFRVEKLVSQ